MRAIGHADRASPFRAYCAGLMLPRVHDDYQLIYSRPEERLSIERLTCAEQRTNIGPRVWKTSPFARWSISPSYVRELSTTNKNSSRKLGWGIVSIEVGAVSTITLSCVRRIWLLDFRRGDGSP